MKRTRSIASGLAALALLFASLACAVTPAPFAATSTSIPSPTPIPSHTPVPSITPSPTPDFSASPRLVADVYSGPDWDYPKLGSVSTNDSPNSFIITGRTADCSWLQVVPPSFAQDGIFGWVHAVDLLYSVSCEAIPTAAIPIKPATATPADTSTPTRRPTLAATLPPPVTKAPPAASCSATDTVSITNENSTEVVITMYGPATYTFHLAPGGNTVNVCPGTYSYTVWICGGMITGTMSSGGSYRAWCHN
jgi:hypothetical protein